MSPFFVLRTYGEERWGEKELLIIWTTGPVQSMCMLLHMQWLKGITEGMLIQVSWEADKKRLDENFYLKKGL